MKCQNSNSLVILQSNSTQLKWFARKYLKWMLRTFKAGFQRYQTNNSLIFMCSWSIAIRLLLTIRLYITPETRLTKELSKIFYSKGLNYRNYLVLKKKTLKHWMKKSNLKKKKNKKTKKRSWKTYRKKIKKWVIMPKLILV